MSGVKGIFDDFRDNSEILFFILVFLLLFFRPRRFIFGDD